MDLGRRWRRWLPSCSCRPLPLLQEEARDQADQWRLGGECLSYLSATRQVHHPLHRLASAEPRHSPRARLALLPPSPAATRPGLGGAAMRRRGLVPAALRKRDQRWQGAAVGWCVRRVIRACVLYARLPFSMVGGRAETVTSVHSTMWFVVPRSVVRIDILGSSGKISLERPTI